MSSSEITSVFQSYILPSLPFRRRKSSTDTATSTSSEETNSRVSSANARSSSNLLHGHTSKITCASCHSELALTSQIISKGFTGRHGKAFLIGTLPTHSFSSLSYIEMQATAPAALLLPNTYLLKPVSRHLVTGMHTVCDINCAICGITLGWKYINAEDAAQRYKVGKFILESKRVNVGSCWEEQDYNETFQVSDSFPSAAGVGSELIEFDSGDEDECEDLFTGTWTPQLAKRRRARRSTFTR